MKYSVSLIIVLFNYILRNVIMKLVKWIGYKTYSKETS